MFWVFCHSCFFRPSVENVRGLYITSCSHMYCDHCIKPDDTFCKRCQKDCKIVKCNSEMPEEVKEVFGDISEKPNILMKVIEFQLFHRTRLITNLKITNQKYQTAKAIIKNMQQKISLLEQKYQSAKVLIRNKEETITNLNRKLQWYHQKCGSRTPVHKPIDPNKQNVSKNQMKDTLFHNLPQSHEKISPSPRDIYTNYRSGQTPYTPESELSKQSSYLSSGPPTPVSRGKPHLTVGNKLRYETPSNSMTLLSLTNRSRSSK